MGACLKGNAAEEDEHPEAIRKSMTHLMQTQRYLTVRPLHAGLSDFEFIKLMVNAASSYATFEKRELEDQFFDARKAASAAKKVVLTGEALTGLFEYASYCPDLKTDVKTSKLLKDVLTVIGKLKRDRKTQKKKLPKRKKEDKTGVRILCCRLAIEKKRNLTLIVYLVLEQVEATRRNCLICGSTTSTRYLLNEQVCNGCYQKAGNSGRREEIKAASRGKNAARSFRF